MKYASLLRLRRIFAAVVFLLFLMAFVLGSLPIDGIARYQIGPALLAGNLLFLAIIIVLTLCLGRVYCACLCPLGIGQDALGRVIKKPSRKPLPRHWPVRVFILVLFAIAFFGGFLTLYGLLDPYSIFGRLSASLFAPVISFIKNIFANVSEYFGIEFPASQEVIIAEWPIFLISFATFLLLFFLVWKFGRAWCNYCPIGTALGLLGGKSLFRIRLDPEKCVGCKRCEKKCKTGCINIQKKEVDTDRCIVCQTCIEECPRDAIRYGKD